MSLSLPATGSAARELFSVAELVAVTTGEQPLPLLGDAIRRARQTIAANKAASRVFSFALDASNDNVMLISIGKRGGWKREWVFGKVPRGARIA